MTAYLSFIKKTFLNRMVYKVDYLIGILNTCIQLFISVTIWKALYGGRESVEGISYAMVVTSIVIGQGLTNAYRINDQAVSKRVKDGSLANCLLRPISFRGQLFAENLGEILFRIVSNFLPAVLIFALTIGLIPPASALNFVLFLLSISLGFLVLWTLSSIVQCSAFWIINVWSISTIKNVFVTVLSGSILPLWFMPESLVKLIRYTPFGSIYFTPVRIYLGQISLGEMGGYFGNQLFWILLLHGISALLWEKGKTNIVLQGG
ncbi:MAG: ABC-2 family transporter protein [Spirochaetales bacterium]|nr:ABC-2 family transporter protein [Spirochaetales bacterium]